MQVLLSCTQPSLSTYCKIQKSETIFDAKQNIMNTRHNFLNFFSLIQRFSSF